ncbi:hypothetical protein [Paenibacillus sp. FSL K6-2524]|uniref:hypothetical protein n=1 Tax=Paenibacillus sp. FSL K6-2524 TaxID=2954516 RepID=UPI0030F5D3E5
MNELAIEHLKSGLSINTHIGCPLGCKYCVLSTIDNYEGRPQHCATPKELIDAILSKDSFYVKDQTPLYINNRTDPFLPDVMDSTYDLLSLLSDYEIKSPIMLITKLSPDERISHYFENLNILFFYTYTGLPHGIDFNSDRRINENNLRQIYSYVPKKSRFLYVRPIIPGINDDQLLFEDIVQRMGVHFDTITVGGVRIFEKNKEQIYPLLGKEIGEVDSKHKYIESEFYHRIIPLSHKYNVNIVRHTSCAIARFMKSKVKLNYFKHANHCNSSCSNYDICSSQSKSLADDKELQHQLDDFISNRRNYEYSFEQNSIHIKGHAEQQLISFIQCTFGISAKADAVKLCPSEQSFLSKHDVNHAVR